ncbi:hypothetical protein D3C79_795350 [compost metagenome]
MGLVVPAGDEVGNGQLRLAGRAAGADVLHVQHPLQVTPGRHPAYPQAGGEGLGERTAKQHAAVVVKRLEGAWARVGVGQVAVYIIFEDRHVVALGQAQQGLLAGLGHDVAERVVAAGGDLDELDRPLLQGQFQRLQADAGDRVGGDFQGFHAQALEGLHGAVEAGGVDRDDIARLAHRANAA